MERSRKERKKEWERMKKRSGKEWKENGKEWKDFCIGIETLSQRSMTSVEGHNLSGWF